MSLSGSGAGSRSPKHVNERAATQLSFWVTPVHTACYLKRPKELWRETPVNPWTPLIGVPFCLQDVLLFV